MKWSLLGRRGAVLYAHGSRNLDTARLYGIATIRNHRDRGRDLYSPACTIGSAKTDRGPDLVALIHGE